MATGTQADYARHRKVSRTAIGKQVKNNLVVWVDDKIDFEASDALLQAQGDPARGGKGGAPNRDQPAPTGKESRAEIPAPPDVGGNSYTFERARREAVERQLKQLELDRQLGTVVEFAAFAKGMEEAASACRKECEGMVARLPSLVAAESDVRRCRDLIEAEVNRAMETLANTCMALAAQRRSATSQ